MSKLRTFFKSHILLVGLAAVVFPLLAIIGLQYWSLRKLEKTSIVAGTVGMKNFLAGVANEVRAYYKSGGEQAPGNMKATEQAWPLTLQFLRKYTR